MSKIKETITALSAGNETGAVRVNREERERMPEWYFEMALRCVERVALIAAVALLVIFADVQKLLALLVFGILFSLVYFGMKDS